MSKLLERHSTAITVTATLVLVASVAFTMYQFVTGGPTSGAGSVYYFDQNTGKLFIASGNALSPIDAPSGPMPDGTPAGVRAHLYAGSTISKNLDGKEIGDLEPLGVTLVYLEMYNSDAQHTAQEIANSGRAIPRGPASPVQRGRMVRRPSDAEWVPAGGKAGKMLSLQSIRDLREGDHEPAPVYPPR